ncbi:lipase [Streptomyces bathyalis]|uniref:Lipase n=1 Tax=Streptomyces bathyalis TaxID=2710756 RepID=A0A7T1T686_9ACTN|nr:lipase family protein [Streptomyces bathyalis]QPP07102.1 lipase [Streptomyces bathyalis]
MAVAALCVSGGAVAPAAAAAGGHAATSHAASKGTSASAGTAAAGQPGDIVSAEPSEFQVFPGVPIPTHAWTIKYNSTDANGKSNTVSGTVLVPKDDREGPRPLLTYAVGTVGIADQCAPSVNFPVGKTKEAPLIEGALLRGWAVAVTDYEGLGTPGTHTYTVGRAAGTAVLDAARAAQRLPGAQEKGVSQDSPVGIMGYSQGGQASGWAAELAGTYAPELKVKGTASGGVPADLPKVAEYNDGDEEAGLVLMSAIGHDAAYPELGLDRYLNDEGRRITGIMKEGCLAEASEAGANKSVEDVTTKDPNQEPDWQQRLAEDKLGTKAPGAPVYLYHGEADEIIPHDVGKQLRADWCAKGNTVEWTSFPLSPHAGTAILASIPAMNWLSDRFKDEPTQGDCGS